MEIAIPLIALGGMYVISNQTKTVKKDTFTNLKQNMTLPNTNIAVSNYPVVKETDFIDAVDEYPNPNVATDKYFNQNAFEQKERANKSINNNIQNIYSLTGDYVDLTEFKHNNMVPFTGSNPHGQNYSNNSGQILDNYVGNGSQTIKKIEQAPLFSPQDNVQWAYGAPNMSEFYQSRVNPAMRNNMVKPFATEQVGPGLNNGYGANGSGGFNSGMESRDSWLPKTVDELRVTTNPKEVYSLDGHEGPSQALIKNTGILGKVEKYTPDTFYINSQDRWLTTTGTEKAGRVVSQEIFKQSNRNETTTQIIGTPSATLKTAGPAPTTHEETKRIQLDGYNVSHSSASGRGPITDGDNYLKSHANYSNSRSANAQPDTYRSGFSGAIGAVIAPLMDILRPSKKEEYSCNVRIYGNLSSNVPSNYMSEEGDIPNTTIKETTLHPTQGYIGNQINGAYTVTNQQSISNQRDTTNCNTFGNATSKYGVTSYDSNYRQTNNDSKEKTIVSRTNHGNSKHFNPHMNITIAKNEHDIINNRTSVPTAPIPSGPSAQMYGKTTVPSYFTESTENNRIDSSLLNAFKENPFTHSLHSAV